MSYKNQLTHYTPSNTKKGLGTLLSSLLGFGGFAVCHLILSLLGAIVLSKNPDPTPLIPFISTISMTVSAIIGGLISSKASQSGGLVISLSFLGILAAVILITSIILLNNRENTPLWQSLLLKIPVILGGIFGGFIGTYKRPKKSKYSKYK